MGGSGAVTRKATLLSFVLISTLLLGCQRGRIVDNLYIDGERGFSVDLLPSGWIRQSQQGLDLFFRDPKTGATVGVAAECRRRTKAPLNILTRHLLFGLEEWRVVERRGLRFGDVEGMETIMVARSDEADVKMSLVVIKRGRCIYDLIYVARPSDFSSGIGDFREMVRSFTLL